MHTPTTTTTILHTSAPTKHYGATRALDGVSIAFAEGTSTAIMGASGSGKTTLLHLLAGIIAPDQGAVTYAHSEISRLSDADRSRLRREQFGFVFQQGLLVPELTAAENVALALMLNGMSKREALIPAGQWLAALGSAGWRHAGSASSRAAKRNGSRSRAPR